jgi:flagellar biosynthesis protein FlhA
MERLRAQSDMVLAGLGFFLLAILVVPLPPVVLDMLLACSFSLALLVFLSTLYVKRAVDLSVFPTLLLGTTLFRLALNVASTRLILLGGAQGGAGAAGNIIEAFGQFVVGGNYAVGLVVFVILVLINFIVITKGAGRVAEVSARFTLDAMPGKQMAIDAELNAGMIDEVQARTRREEVAREADFFGSMDGASKFVKGDAIAGIVITLVNVVGGIFIGVVQGDLGLVEALETYTILTIGDGLVGQMPALILSAAAGILVTRVDDPTSQRLDQQLTGQLLASPRVLAALAFCLAGFALVPGLRVPFLLIAALVGAVAWHLHKNPAPDPVTEEKAEQARAAEARPLGPEDMLSVEPLTLEVGIDLLYLVDDKRGGDLVERVQRIRNQFARELGVVLPTMNLRDDLNLEPNAYRLLLRGEEIGAGVVQPRQHLAIDPGDAKGGVRGVKTTDPVFGLPALWVPKGQVLKAQARGYTVVDVPTVLTTHLTELMHLHAHELYDMVQLCRTLERVGEVSPQLVEDLVPDPLPRQSLLRVFRNLLREGVSVRDVNSIFEALSDYAPKTRDADVLTEFVRQRLARHITARFADPEGTIHYLALGPDAEDAVSKGLQGGEGGSMSLVLDPQHARALLAGIRDQAEGWAGAGQVVVLCPPLARGPLRRLAEKVIPRVPILSPSELRAGVHLERIGVISLAAARAR